MLRLKWGRWSPDSVAQCFDEGFGRCGSGGNHFELCRPADIDCYEVAVHVVSNFVAVGAVRFELAPFVVEVAGAAEPAAHGVAAAPLVE